jgi:UDP-2,3-diacylglucosamine pyrophosphatase LpxH
MRRIKLILSDFHLGTGRISADGTVNDVEDFISDRAFADLLEYYRTGEFVDTEAEVILNGDVFECLGQVEPGDDDPTMITSAKSLAKIDRIIDGHPEIFEALAAFADSDRRQVTFVVGNHDQDLVWEDVRARLKERVHPDVRFIDEVYRFDGVHVEHGHLHEAHNHVDSRKLYLTKGLAEPILNLPWGSDLFLTSAQRMKRLRPYLNRVRPFRLAFFWSLFHDFRIVMRGIWYFFSAIFRARFRKHRQRRITFMTTLRVLFGMSAYPTLEDAAARVLRGDDAIHTVIFGHTHIPMTRQIAPGRRYLNSGTWIPNSNLHIAALGLSLLQTYIFIDYEKDRARCRLKRWHGRRVIEEDVVM